jgi:hypothetical protein
MLLLAWASWRWVETPLRRRGGNRRRFVALAASVSAAVLTLAGLMWLHGGSLLPKSPAQDRLLREPFDFAKPYGLGQCFLTESASSSSYSFSPGRRPENTIGISSSVWPASGSGRAPGRRSSPARPCPAPAPGRCRRWPRPAAPGAPPRDGHEVANDVRVRDGHRAAAGDLLLELRDHAAAAAQHVAEAHGHEAGARVLRHQVDTAISAARLLAPITLVGLTALSVLISTKRSAPHSAAASAAW